MKATFTEHEEQYMFFDKILFKSQPIQNKNIFTKIK